MRNKLIITGVVLLLIALFLVLLREQLLLAIGDFLIVSDDLHPADVIHVIAGEDYRLDYAIQLYQHGYAKQIFLTGGGWCPIHHMIHEEIWRKRAVEQGVPLEAIVIDDKEITSTYSETLRLRNFINQSLVPIQSVIVVSDPFHMRRARWISRLILGKQITVEMAPVPFKETPFQRQWWLEGVSKKYVEDEYMKFLYYIARYQLSRGPVREWLASLDTG